MRICTCGTGIDGDYGIGGMCHCGAIMSDTPELDLRSLLAHVDEALDLLDRPLVNYPYFWFKCGLVADRIGTAGALGYYSVDLVEPMFGLMKAAGSQSEAEASKHLREVRRLLLPCKESWAQE